MRLATHPAADTYGCREFDSAQKAEQFKQFLLENYPPQGYGTSLQIAYYGATSETNPEKWSVEWKIRNCD